MEFPEFLSRFTDCKFTLNEKLSKYGGYKTGGRAKFFITPLSVKSLSETVNYCAENKIKYAIIGKATNVLFSDKGFDGAIVKTDGIKGISLSGETVAAFCGEPLAAVCAFAEKHGLSGLEKFSGIPGSVGGAAVMNAGAFGGNVSNVIECVSALKDGKTIKYSKSECKFSYRKSRFINSDEIVASVVLKLKKCDRAEIENKTALYAEKRRLSQPSGRSCGSAAFFTT